jgi:hypothetical protein
MRVPVALAERFKTRFKEGGILECWPWCGSVSMDGYGILNYRNQKIYAHVISFSYYRYPVMKDMTVSHKCNNKACMNPYHLQVKFNKPLRQGARNYNAILSEKDIPKIRKRYAECKSAAVVARAFHVAENTILDVIKGRTWKHV